MNDLVILGQEERFTGLPEFWHCCLPEFLIDKVEENLHGYCHLNRETEN